MDNRERIIRLWFEEWNTRGTVLQWDIKQFFHKDNQTIVEWYFKNKMDDGNVEAFDGISLIEWTPDDKIALLKEFGCNENRYDPYKDGTIPHFRDENAKWFQPGNLVVGGNYAEWIIGLPLSKQTVIHSLLANTNTGKKHIAIYYVGNA